MDLDLIFAFASRNVGREEERLHAEFPLLARNLLTRSSFLQVLQRCDEENESEDQPSSGKKDAHDEAEAYEVTTKDEDAVPKAKSSNENVGRNGKNIHNGPPCQKCSPTLKLTS